MHILWRRSDICSCKFYANVSLMLGNPFPVRSLCKLNHISVCFIHISTKITCKQIFFLQLKPSFFWRDSQCFWPIGKFQHNIKISINTTRVSVFAIFPFLVTMTWLSNVSTSWLRFYFTGYLITYWWKRTPCVVVLVIGKPSRKRRYVE